MTAFGTFTRRARGMPRVARRLLVAVTFLAYPALIAGSRLVADAGPGKAEAWMPAFLLLLVLGELGGLALLVAYVGRRADPGHPGLDERERAGAVRALALAYRILAGAAAVGVVGVALWIWLVGPVRLDATLMLPLAAVAVAYLPTIPSAVVAWSEPDIPADEHAAP